MDVLTLLVFAIFNLTIVLLHLYFSQYHSYWRKKGITTAKNCLPFIGHVSPIGLIRHMSNLVVDVYKSYPDQSMIGFYNYRIPCLIVRDPDLVKTILITKFANFSDNNLVLQEHEEPLLSKNPFFTNGSAWKTGRTRLTSSLSGNKLKTYSPMILEITNKLTNYVNQHLEQTNFEVEAKDLFSRVTGEVAATVGFRIEGHCFDDSKNSESFAAFGHTLFATDLKTVTKTLLLRQFPWLLGFLNVPFVPKDFEDFFCRLVKRAVDSRKVTGTNGKNVIDLIIDQEEKEGDLEKRYRDITSHMMSFFLDIFETTAMVMTFLAYNLSVHKNVQNKVRNEIRKVMRKHGELTYEAVNEMVYLEHAMSESMRLFPVVDAQVKCCTRTTELEGFDGTKCVVEPGTRIYIPVGGLHRDPQFWDEPDDFNPERFGENEVRGRNKTVFLPFGEGPRMCPGRKIATLVVKMTFAAMLTKFEFDLSKKTKVPLRFDRFSLLPSVVGGMWLNIKKI